MLTAERCLVHHSCGHCLTHARNRGLVASCKLHKSTNVRTGIPNRICISNLWVPIQMIQDDELYLVEF